MCLILCWDLCRSILPFLVPVSLLSADDVRYVSQAVLLMKIRAVQR